MRRKFASFMVVLMTIALVGLSLLFAAIQAG
jgi:hypothetical protein